MSKSIPLHVVEAGEGSRAERSDAVANRRRILATAKALFAEHGVAEVNMADIAQAACVGKGTLYRRFANKGELCYALMDEQLTEFQNRMLAEMQAMNAAGERQLDQLLVFLAALVEFTERHMPLLSEVQNLRQNQINVALPHFWQRMTIHGLLQTAVRSGECAEDLDLDLLADLLLAPFSANFYRFMREVRGFSTAQIGAGVRTLVLGLRT